MRTRTLAIILLTAFLLTGCQQTDAARTESIFPGEALTPYSTHTATSTATEVPLEVPTETPVPTATSTPTSYTVKGNDTLFSIAANNGITLDQIKAANPDVNPYLLGPGTVIVIPAPGGAGSTAPGEPTSTPYAMDFSDPHCTPSQTGGLYCFAELINPQPMMLDNLSAQFKLTDPASGEVISLPALVPLNRLASGGNLPLFAYFPPPVAANPQIGLQVLTSMPVNQDGTPSALQSAIVTVDQPEPIISANRLSAVVNTQARFDGAEGLTGKIWIAAVAYDANGQIVGIRRFTARESIAPGVWVPFTLNIYSIGEKIEKVELFGEVNP